MTIFNKGMVKNCKKKSKNKASNSESFDGTFRQIDFRMFLKMMIEIGLMPSTIMSHFAVYSFANNDIWSKFRRNFCIGI